jgi:hypothetical protein
LEKGARRRWEERVRREDERRRCWVKKEMRESVRKWD